jgi:hypothetical protein
VAVLPSQPCVRPQKTCDLNVAGSTITPNQVIPAFPLSSPGA